MISVMVGLDSRACELFSMLLTVWLLSNEVTVKDNYVASAAITLSDVHVH